MIFHIQIIFFVLPVSFNNLVFSIPTSKSCFLCTYMQLAGWNDWKAKTKDLIKIQEHNFQLYSRIVPHVILTVPNIFHLNWKFKQLGCSTDCKLVGLPWLLSFYFTSGRSQGILTCSGQKGKKAIPTTNTFMLLLVSN